MNEIEIHKDKTIAEMVTENYRVAGVLKKYGLDFCCGGNVSLEEACEKKKLDASVIKSEIEIFSKLSSANNIRFDAWPIDKIIFYITNHHHVYVTEAIARIIPYADKVVMRHGDNFPEINEIRAIFGQLAVEMDKHMKEEEEIAFPLIEQIAAGEAVNETDLKVVLESLEDDHSNAGSLMWKIRELTNNFTPPAWACQTFRVLWSELEDFEADLHHHVHLENNILFNKVKYLLVGA